MASFTISDLPINCQDRIMPEPMSGCSLWIGSRDRKQGYRRTPMRRKGIGRAAHRFVYYSLAGEFDLRLQLDHVCRNTCCVNPAHLEPVSNLENTRRGIRNQYTGKTHCPKGHPYFGENLLLVARRGKHFRYCRTCNVASTNRSRQRHGTGKTDGQSLAYTGRTYSKADPTVHESIAFRNVLICDGRRPIDEGICK
jgi:hypothetical protein